jgi:hypothetical protein
MSNRHWVTAHGKTFAVRTLETPSMAAHAARKAKRGEEFAIVPLKWAAGIARDTNTHHAWVWIVLLYLSWQAKSPTFPVSNAIFIRYGISHDTKTRALKELEAIGRIVVQQRPGCAPIVTLVGFPEPR